MPALRELKLEVALGVRLVDKETQTPAGSLLIGSERQRAWRPNESFFLQAVGDQLLISVNHTRTQAVVRTLRSLTKKPAWSAAGRISIACSQNPRALARKAVRFRS